MSQLVVLSFGGGQIRNGFSAVTAQLWDACDPLPMKKLSSQLPPAPEVLRAYQRWQHLYLALQQRLNVHPRIRLLENSITNVSEQDFEQICQELSQSLNRWLYSDPFRMVDQQLRVALDASDEIRVVIESDDTDLQRLPWHLWNFFDAFPNAELAYSVPNIERPKRVSRRARKRVKVLAILGHSKSIHVEADRSILSGLKDADIEILTEPRRQELNARLWEQGWDILFFAGHSLSKPDDRTGSIDINSEDSLAITHLRNSLRAAIRNGLQIAIFNSCDGLGLARELADLNIPQVVVMRERVPDKIAQEFVREFMPAFSRGKSFFTAVREAREKLQCFEAQYPCASWLPVIFQNPTQEPLTWQQLLGQYSHRVTTVDNFSRLPSLGRILQSMFRIARLLQVSLLVTALVVGMRLIGVLEPLELQVFDLMMRSRPSEGIDPRILLIEITQQDLDYQRQRGDRMQRQSQSYQTRGEVFDISLSDTSLNQLLTRLTKHRPRVIGLDINRDFPVEQQFLDLKQRLETLPNLFVICKAEDFSDPSVPSIDPPPEVSMNRVGFSDFQRDEDTILRRHLLGMRPPLRSPESRCNTNLAFSTQIAFYYLRQQGIQANFTVDGNLQIGERVFPILTSHAGGYHRLKQGGGGSHLLLNYRASQPMMERVTLTQFLTSQPNAASIEDQIILIGGTWGTQDTWATPFGIHSSNLMRGVEVHAHMISQIVSAAVDDRPLLRVLSLWQDAAWIFGWATVGAIVTGQYHAAQRSLRRLLSNAAISILFISGVLYGLCLLLLVQGIWIPFIPSLIAIISAGVLAHTLIFYLSRFSPTNSSKTSSQYHSSNDFH